MRSLKIIVPIIIFFLTACEYEPTGEFHVEIDPPDEEVNINILLNDIAPNDTILVDAPHVRVNLQINTPKDLLGIYVYINDEEYTYLLPHCTWFETSYHHFDEGIHNLRLHAIFDSGSGSLAGMMGYEYEGDVSWKLLVLRAPGAHFKLDYGINGDGSLEFSWSNAIPKSYISHYSISRPIGTDVYITDPNKEFYVDPLYICGIGYFVVETHLKDNTGFYRVVLMDAPVPQIQFEDLNTDNLRVYWEKPLAKGRYNLQIDGVTITSELYDTTLIVPQLFGRVREMRVTFLPYTPGDGPSGLGNWNNSWDYHALGNLMPHEYNPTISAYSTHENVFYMHRSGILTAFNGSTMEVLTSLNSSWKGKIAAAPHNSKVAVMTKENIQIFPNSSLTNPLVIEEAFNYVINPSLTLTTDDRLFVAIRESKTCRVYSAETGQSLFNFQYTHQPSTFFPNSISVSDDGKYFCSSSLYGVEIFGIEGTSNSIIYSDQRTYSGAMFVPSQPNLLLLRVNSQIELRQLPNFDLIQSLSLTEYQATIHSIDPKTQNLLYHGNDTLRICNINNLSETLLKIPSDNYVQCTFFNNIILSRNTDAFSKPSIYLDISTYLNNPLSKF